MEIFVCKLTGNFMSGINLLQRRGITVKEPFEFVVRLVTKKMNRVECTLPKKDVINLKNLKKP